MPRKGINFDLDLLKKEIFPRFAVKQLDDAIFTVNLKKNGTDYDVTGSTCKLFVGVTGEVFLQDTDIVVNANTVTITLDRNLLQKTGKAYAELEITDTEGTTTTSTFIFDIDRKIGEGATVPGSVEGFVAKYERLISEFKADIDSSILENNTKVDEVITELQQDYDSLKKIVIDENASANLQNQINNTNSQLETKANLEDLQNHINNHPSGGEGGRKVVYNVLDYNIATDKDDNTVELQSLVDLVHSNGGGTIYFPTGTYNFKSCPDVGSYNHRYAIITKSNVSIIGENLENTILKCSELETYSLFYYHPLDATPITGCVYSNFTVDCYATGNINKVWGKAFFYQYVENCVFRDLILKGTIATALGIDYLNRVHIDNVTCIDCGRTFTNVFATTGTSGIGIGTGGFENENFTINNCKTINCGQYGIFIENQFTLNWGGSKEYSKGCVISNCITRNGLFRGIGVRGGQNVTVIGCQSYENAEDGLFIDNLCKNVKVVGNILADNKKNGIFIGIEKDSSLISIANNDINNNLENGIKTYYSKMLTDASISSNNIFSNGKYGIWLNGATKDVLLKDNVVKKSTESIVFSQSYTHENAIIKDNIFVNGVVKFDEKFIGDNAYNDLVNKGDVSPTSISANDMLLLENSTKKIEYSILPHGVDQSSTFTTNDTNIISINNSTGEVTGLKEGVASLTIASALDVNVSKVITVTVSKEIVAPQEGLVVRGLHSNGLINDVEGQSYTITTEGQENAIDDYIKINGLDVNFFNNVDHTVLVRLKASSISEDQSPLSSYRNLIGFGILKKADGMYSVVKNPPTSDVVKISDDLVISDYNTFAYSYSTSLRQSKFYINGTLLRTVDVAPTNESNKSRIKLNCDFSIASLPYSDSKIDVNSLYIYDRVLADDEVMILNSIQ